MNKIVFCLMFSFFVLLWGQDVSASFDVYEFDTPTQEQRFRRLTAELRCPKCQNQSIADSDAALAIDLKNIVYEMVKAGKSDVEIKNFMRDRYGDFILYRPPIEPKNYLLWFGPFVVLFIGLVAIFAMAKSRKRAQQKQATLDASEQERLKKLTSEIEGSD